MDRTCPICACARKRSLYKQDFNNQDICLVASYDVAACKDCGFVYADNVPSEEECGNYYKTMSKYEFNDNGGKVCGDYKKYFRRVFDFLEPHLPNRKTGILDVGCSTGGLLSIFKENGYKDIIGIDPSPSCVKSAKELCNIDAEAKNITDFNTDKKFDLVILSAVLEHLPIFKTCLEKARLLLKERGLLFIEVPDAWRFYLYITSPFQQFSIEHINYFSVISLRNLLTKFNFQTIKMDCGEVKMGPVLDPDIFVLSQKADVIEHSICRDEVSELSIRQYITKCLKADLEIKGRVAEKLLNKDKIIVWGAGTHTQRLLGSCLDHSKILYFVDSNARYIGKSLKAIEIRSPRDIKEHDVPILISTYAYQQEIAEQIRRDFRLNNEIIKIY